MKLNNPILGTYCFQYSTGWTMNINKHTKDRCMQYCTWTCQALWKKPNNFWTHLTHLKSLVEVTYWKGKGGKNISLIVLNVTILKLKNCLSEIKYKNLRSNNHNMRVHKIGYGKKSCEIPSQDKATPSYCHK